MKAAQAAVMTPLIRAFFFRIVFLLEAVLKTAALARKIVISFFFVFPWLLRIASQDHYLGTGPAFCFSPLVMKAPSLGTPPE